MNLFGRLKEFGTLRAIGYSRRQCGSIIFAELFVLALIATGVAAIFAGIFVSYFGYSGVYVGFSMVSWAVGGERLYLFMKINDFLFTIIVIFLFTLVATLNPSLQMCYQKIFDILAKRQKKIFSLKALRQSLSKKEEEGRRYA